MIIGVVLLVSSGAAYLASLRATRLNKDVVFGQNQIGLLKNTLSTIQTMEGGERGFLLTGSESYLQPYKAGLLKVELNLQRWKDKGIAEEDMKELVPAIKAKLQELNQMIELRRTQGFDAAQAKFNAVGHIFQDDIRSIIERIEDKLQGELAAIKAKSELAYSIREWTFLLGGILNLCFLIWACRRIWVLIRLQQSAASEVQHAKDQVEEASRAKDAFMAMLSHELRTPLAPVMAILSSFEKESLPESLRQPIEMMRRNITLEARLIDDLLDLTRLTRGTMTLSRQRVDMHDLARETLDMFEAEIQEKELQLVVKLKAENAFVNGDATRLQQVLWNIVGNAVKFSGKRGRLEIQSGNPDSETFEISISDSGIGISKETIQRLFRPFEQASYHEGRMYGGLGLGMAISKRLLDLHGGDISVQSDGPGTGSSFSVRLPVSGIEEPVAPAVPKTQAPVASKFSILLVEDHSDTAEALRMLLTKSGHQVAISGTVRDALEKLNEASFDLLLSDLGLPDGTGLDLIRQVREFSQIPAIALSGHGMAQDIDACMKAGFDHHLTKPLSIQELRKEIQNLRKMEPELVQG